MPVRVHPDSASRNVETCSSPRSRPLHDSARRFLRAVTAALQPGMGLNCIVKLCNLDAMTQSLGADLLSVVARINRLATQRARLPLPYAQARLLSTIEDQGPTRISDLAALDHCSQPTMTTQVRRLEDGGFVSRTVDPGDARAVLIRITPKGVDTLRQVRLDRGAAIDPYLERLEA